MTASELIKKWSPSQKRKMLSALSAELLPNLRTVPSAELEAPFNQSAFDELMRQLDELPPLPPPTAEERAARRAELDRRMATREPAVEFDEFMEILSKEP